MARYGHLPIWKDATSLAVLQEEAVRRFPDYHKYTLGTDLRRQAYAVCRGVVVANAEREGRARLVVEDPAQLVAWRAANEAFLAERLGLRLNALSAPLPVGGGIDSLGYVARRTYRLPGRRVLRQAHARLESLAARIVRWQSGCWTVRWTPALREHLRTTWASMLGHLSRAVSRRQALALWRPEDGYLKHGLKRRVLQKVGWPAASAQSIFAPTPASGARHAS